MRRNAPAVLLAATIACVGASTARAQSECPAALHAPEGGVRWCELSTKPSLAADAPLPRYHAMLRAARYSGEVDVAADVDDSGRVVPASVRVLHATHELFLVNVRAAVRQWRFTGTGSDGRPFALLVRAVFEIPPEDVPARPITEVTPTAAGLDLRLGEEAIPFAPPAHVDSADLDSAIAATVDTVLARRTTDSVSTFCVAREEMVLPARVVARLRAPIGLTFAPDRCRRSIGPAFVFFDSLGSPLRTRPGEREPLRLEITAVQPWTADVFRMHVRAMLGRGGRGYICDAFRDASGGPWRAACESHEWFTAPQA